MRLSRSAADGVTTPEFHRHDQWWVSPFNVTGQVRRSFSLPPRVQIHDAALRGGEQTPGVVFSVADKIAIAQALAEVGVDPRAMFGTHSVSTCRSGDVALGKKSAKPSNHLHA